MRLLIFSGHTMLQRSAAALATACHAARRGQRVLLASFGPSHLIGALLGQNLGPRPLELEPNLAALEIGPLDELGSRWDLLRPTLRSGLAARLRDITSDELPSFPGMDAISTLMVAERARQTGRFDLLIIDGPAPDDLIRGLALSDTMRWLLRLVFGLDRGPGRSRTSQDAAIVPGAIIPSSTTAPLQDLRVEFEEYRNRFDASTGARVRLVMSPEELHLPPVRDNLVALGLYGIAVDEIIVPAEPADVSLETRHTFGPEGGPARPTLHISPLPTSPTDRDTWALRGAAFYRDGDIGTPAPHPHGAEREVRLSIPFLDAKALDIAVANEEVAVRIGQLRRHLLLPGLIEGGRLRARVEGEVLRLWVE
ncbi:ATPase [Oscillochloris sp. ZM17-4]|uniref:ArsA-related P-loop ATPase n=1 Tax=Oscillochloris sp. ZM17-4 TaxID=2866714 RepID=UPI001C73AA23|nr:ArsA-related P-loop ATPase [Oscillochloris sp. ZM17-4]MBX0330796.1 ATPase [Oscillochloris sp. ZM17-4]